MEINWVYSKTTLYVAVFLMVFGIFNLSTSNFVAAQQQEAQATSPMDAIVMNLISQTGPLVGGAAIFLIQFLRKQGVKISAEAEEYFVTTAKSFVANQSRFLYKTIIDEPGYKEFLLQGKVPPELGRKALDNVKKELRTQLVSKEFTNTTRKMLDDNLETLIERYVTEEKKELADRGRKLLNELVPTAVNVALLPFDTPGEAKKKKVELAEEALEAVTKSLNSQKFLLPQADVEMMVKSELSKKIGPVTVKSEGAA